MALNETASDDVSIADVIELIRGYGRIVWHGRRLVVRPVIIGVIVGLIVAFGSREEFTADMRVLPYRSASTGSGSLSSLAGLAGLKLPAGLSDQIITADLYPVIAKTLDFRISVAETPLRFQPGAAPQTAVAFLESHRSISDIVSDFVGSMRSSVESAFTGDKPLPVAAVAGASNGPLTVYSRRYLRTIENLDERLTVTMDRKTSVITIQGVMPTRYAAADFVQTVSQRLMQRLTEYEAKKAGEQLAFIEDQYQQCRVRYEKAQRQLAEFSDRNRILNSAVAQIEKDRLQREFDAEFGVLQQLNTELQQARIKKNQDTPAFTILEQVFVPTNRSSPRRSFIVLMSVAVGLAFGIGHILLTNFRHGRPA